MVMLATRPSMQLSALEEVGLHSFQQHAANSSQVWEKKHWSKRGLQIFNFCERGERPFFRISGSLSYSPLHPFSCDLSPCFDTGWPSLIFLSFCLLLSLSYSSILLYLIRFLSFIVLLDVWLGFSIYTILLLIRCVYSFVITFHVRILRSATHDVFYALHLMHEGYEDYIIGIFESSFLSFL